MKIKDYGIAFVCEQVWMYEACRLFRDKLVEEEDIQKFDGFLLSSAQSDWGVDMRESLLNTFFVTAAISTVSDKWFLNLPINFFYYYYFTYFITNTIFSYSGLAYFFIIMIYIYECQCFKRFPYKIEK